MITTKAGTLALFVGMAFLSCTKELQVYDAGNLVPKTVDQDSSLPSITVNGARLHALAFGAADSTLVICLHGGPGANFRYMLNCKSLADKGYRVVFYDQRGSGLSERFRRQWYQQQGANTLEKVFYDDLTAVINFYKTHPAQKVVLLGHSWGAMMASGYTAKYPGNIHGLIVAEPGGLKWQDIDHYLRKSRAYSLWSEAFNDATYLDQFITGNKNQHEILDYKLMVLSADNKQVGDIKPDLGPNAIHYTSSRDGAVISAAMFDFGEKYQPDFTIGLSGFQKKTLFLYGSNNKAYPDSWAARISEAFSLTELFKVQGAGHSGMLDQISIWTNLTEPVILDYLRSL